MIRRTYAPAQPTLTSGDDRVQGACVGRPQPFDDLIDYSSGPRYLFARAEARSLCASCPLMASCLNANRHEQWAAAVLGIDPRDEPTRDDRCGSTRGYDGHRKRKEKPCDECKAAAAKAKARRLQARRRATA